MAEELGQVAVPGPALDRQRALAGRRQHVLGLEDLAHHVEPAQPAQPGAASTTASSSPAPTLPSRVSDVAADGHAADVLAQQQQLGRAARRPGADRRRPAADRPAWPRPGDQSVARILPDRHRGQHDSVGRPVGRSFSECTARSTSAGQQRVAQSADEHAGAADLGQLSPADVTLRGHADQFDRVPGAFGDGLGRPDRTGPSPSGSCGCRAAAPRERRAAARRERSCPDPLLCRRRRQPGDVRDLSVRFRPGDRLDRPRVEVEQHPQRLVVPVPRGEPASS